MYQLLSFHDTVNANSDKTLVGSRLNFPYVVREHQIDFALGCENKLKIRIFLSEDPTAPPTGEPQGTNVFRTYGQQDYIVGDDAHLNLSDDHQVPARGTYIKVYADNQDTALHEINVRVVIDIIPEEVT